MAFSMHSSAFDPFVTWRFNAILDLGSWIFGIVEREFILVLHNILVERSHRIKSINFGVLCGEEDDLLRPND